jgi:hypothetical protein
LAGGGDPAVAENESVGGLTTSDEGSAASVNVTGRVKGLFDAPTTDTTIDPA